MSSLFLRRPTLDGLPPLAPPPDGLTLRPAAGGDADALADLLTAAFGEAWDADRARRDLLDAPDVVETWLIVGAGDGIATASARLLPDAYPGSGYVHWVAARPEWAGRGLGRVVTLAVLHAFLRLGCRDAVLETDDHRLPAIKTYLKLGFVPEHRDATHAERWARIRLG